LFSPVQGFRDGGPDRSRPARHGTPLSAGNTQATPIASASF
jgi:hypothetical protein